MLHRRSVDVCAGLICDLNDSLHRVLRPPIMDSDLDDVLVHRRGWVYLVRNLNGVLIYKYFLRHALAQSVGRLWQLQSKQQKCLGL